MRLFVEVGILYIGWATVWALDVKRINDGNMLVYLATRIAGSLLGNKKDASYVTVTCNHGDGSVVGLSPGRRGQRLGETVVKVTGQCKMEVQCQSRHTQEPPLLKRRTIRTSPFTSNCYIFIWVKNSQEGRSIDLLDSILRRISNISAM